MDIYEKISRCLLEIKNKVPLVHHITNYVTVNDCANIVLALGGSPVMADDEMEVEDMVSSASALVINMGTLNSRTVASMIKAGKKANELGIPVVLDPVGVGATKYRTDIGKRLLKEIDFTVIKGNISEVKNLSGITSLTKGVDAEDEDFSKDISEKKLIGENLSKKLNTVIAITGEIDVISYNDETYLVHNGNPMMGKITGTGCMCASLIGTFCGAEKNYLMSTVAGVLTMGIAGDIAYEKTVTLGTGSFKVALMDAIYSMNSEIYIKRSKIDYHD